jgi:hypothetical protein
MCFGCRTLRDVEQAAVKLPGYGFGTPKRFSEPFRRRLELSRETAHAAAVALPIVELGGKLPTGVRKLVERELPGKQEPLGCWFVLE